MYKKENMGLLDLLGLGNKSNEIKEFVQKGAVILDVRTKEEYNDGHIKGSKNIALQSLNTKIDEIKKWNKPIIACCRSGMRSASHFFFKAKRHRMYKRRWMDEFTK